MRVQGQEFAEAYVLEYRRLDTGPWIRFRDHDSNKVSKRAPVHLQSFSFYLSITDVEKLMLIYNITIRYDRIISTCALKLTGNQLSLPHSVIFLCAQLQRTGIGSEVSSYE